MSAGTSTPEWGGAAFHAAEAAMVVTDTAGTVQVVNSAFADLTGLASRAVVGRDWPELLAEHHVEPARAMHAQALRAGATPPRRTVDLLTMAGRPRSVVVSVRPAGASAVVLTLAEPQPRAEVVRAISELRTEGGDSALWSLDLTSKELHELFGPSRLTRDLVGGRCTLEECLGQVHPDDRARLEEAITAAGSGENVEQRFRVFDLTGMERWLHTRARYIGGDRPRLVGVLDDVTNHVQLVRRLANRRRQEDDQGRRINEFTAKLVSATTADEIAGLLTDSFKTIFFGDSAQVVLGEPGKRRILPLDAPDIRDLLVGDSVCDHAFPVGAVLADGQPRFLDSRDVLVETFPQARADLVGTDAQAWAIAPLFGEQRTVLGAWQVSWREPHLPSHDERAVILTLAGLAGQALQRVHNQASELELADAIQKRMLSAEPIASPGLDVAVRYLPSRAEWLVCGDFYDTIPLRDDRVGLLVGDVKGHGVEAAAAMGQIRMAMRAYASTMVDPGAVLAATNRLLAEAVDIDGSGDINFATCGYIVIHPKTGQMEAAWAGQPPAVIATEGSYELWQPETGLPVGVDGGSDYPVTRRVLAPEETLLMCSDGLVESASLVMEDGLDAVGQEVSRLVSDVDAAASALEALVPAGRKDDIALLVARLS